MIIGSSKELSKVEVDFDKFDLNKLQSHEVFGLYLIGEISFRKLMEVFEIKDALEMRKIISRICEDIDSMSNKDESEVEIDF